MDFVKQWWKDPKQLQPLEKAYKNNAKALIGLRNLKKAGKVTDKTIETANQQLLKVCMPELTPARLIVGRQLKAEYVKQANIGCIPTLAIETAISEHEWSVQDGSGTDSNTLIDKFHLISALPYVDEIVSNDRFFHRVYPIIKGTGHVRAKLLRNDEFLTGFS